MKITGMKAVVAGVKLGPSGGRAAATFKVDVLASEGTREGAALKEHAPEIGPLQRHALERQLTSDKKDREELLIDGKRFGLGEHSLKLWGLPAESRGEKCAPLLDVTATLGKKVRVFIGPAEARVRFDLVVGTGHLASVTVRELEALIEAEGWFDLAELQTTLDEAPKAKKRGRKKKDDTQLPLTPSTAAPAAPAGATGFGALAEPRKRVERDVAPVESAPQEPPPETRVCVVAPGVDLGFDPVGMSGPELAHDLLEKTRDELVVIAQTLGLPHDGGHGAMVLVIATRLCVAPPSPIGVEETSNAPDDELAELVAEDFDPIPWATAGDACDAEEPVPTTTATASTPTATGMRRVALHDGRITNLSLDPAASHGQLLALPLVDLDFFYVALGGTDAATTREEMALRVAARIADLPAVETTAADAGLTARELRAKYAPEMLRAYGADIAGLSDAEADRVLLHLSAADLRNAYTQITGHSSRDPDQMRAALIALVLRGEAAEPTTTATKPGVTVRRRKAKGAGAETWSDAVAASAEAPVVVPSVVPDLPVDLSLGFDPTMLTLEELEVEVTALSSDKLRVVHRQLTGSVPKGKAEETVKTVLGRLRMHARRDSASASA